MTQEKYFYEVNTNEVNLPSTVENDAQFVFGNYRETIQLICKYLASHTPFAVVENLNKKSRRVLKDPVIYDIIPADIKLNASKVYDYIYKLAVLFNRNEPRYLSVAIVPIVK